MHDLTEKGIYWAQDLAACKQLIRHNNPQQMGNNIDEEDYDDDYDDDALA